jgi:hypothetical protein
MKKNIIHVCLLSLMGIGSFKAQQQVIVTEQDGKVIKTKVVREKKPIIVVDNSWALKFDVVKMMRGEMNFSLEKRMTDRLSLEYGLGLTISEVDYLSNFHFGGGYGTKANSNFGFLASLATRYYPLEDYKVFNRFYVSPMLKFANFNTNYVYEGAESTYSKNGYQNKGSFTFNFGIQSWVSSTFAMDFYLGLGLGYYNNVSYSMDYNGVDQVWQTYKSSGANYVFTTGLKVAIGN